MARSRSVISTLWSMVTTGSGLARARDDSGCAGRNPRSRRCAGRPALPRRHGCRGAGTPCRPRAATKSIAACRSLTSPWLARPSPTWTVQQPWTSQSLRKRCAAVLDRRGRSPSPCWLQRTRPSEAKKRRGPNGGALFQQPPGHDEVRRVRPCGDDPVVAGNAEIGEGDREAGVGQRHRRARHEGIARAGAALGRRLPEAGVEIARRDRPVPSGLRIGSRSGRVQPLLHLERDRRRARSVAGARVVRCGHPREMAARIGRLLAVGEQRAPRQDLDHRPLQREQHRVARAVRKRSSIEPSAPGRRR